MHTSRNFNINFKSVDELNFSRIFLCKCVFVCVCLLTFISLFDRKLLVAVEIIIRMIFKDLSQDRKRIEFFSVSSCVCFYMEKIREQLFLCLTDLCISNDDAAVSTLMRWMTLRFLGFCVCFSFFCWVVVEDFTLSQISLTNFLCNH